MPFIDDQGVFTEDFRTQLPAMLGDEFKDSKAFDDVKDLPSLAKSFAATKSAFGKKLEGMIQRPAADAPAEKLAEYRQQLARELGAPEKLEGYEFYKPEKMPDGVGINETVQKGMAALALKHGVPASFLKEASKLLIDSQVGDIQTNRAAAETSQKQEFDDMVAHIKQANRGDELTKNLRLACKAVQGFASPELKKTITDAKIFDTPTDFEAWQKAGVNVQSLPLWINIGKRMGTNPMPKNEAGSGSAGASAADRAKNRYNNPKSAELHKG